MTSDLLLFVDGLMRRWWHEVPEAAYVASGGPKQNSPRCIKVGIGQYRLQYH